MEKPIQHVNEMIIKGMVCQRCIHTVQQVIDELGFEAEQVSLGKVLFAHHFEDEDLLKFNNQLSANGFEIIFNKRKRIIDQIKWLIEDILNNKLQYDSKIKFSAELVDNLHLNYDSISKLFTESEGITLERYFIERRIQKVRDLLTTTSMTISEVAYTTGFSSVNHLSHQFKEITGLNPTAFKSQYINRIAS